MNLSLFRKYFFIIFFLFPLNSCEDFIIGPDPENTPTNNFEILWREFDFYYPSFIVRNINWDSLHSNYRTLISKTTSENELWNILTSMLYNFNDIHVNLYNGDGSKYFNSSHIDGSIIYEFSLELIKNRYLLNNFHVAGEGNFTYGRISNDSIGYIHIASFGGNNSWVGDLDFIISILSEMKAIIIDIRNNTGGIIENFNYVASSFIDRPTTFRKEITRNGPEHNNFTSPYFHTINPRPFSPTFTKQIILLTNRITGSVSEFLALFLKQLPYSTQIGDSTAGGLGIIRGFQLPNGWLFQMPLALTLTLYDQSLEGIGVVPDVYVRNSRQEILNGFDRQLETAIEYATGLKK